MGFFLLLVIGNIFAQHGCQKEIQKNEMQILYTEQTAFLHKTIKKKQLKLSPFSVLSIVMTLYTCNLTLTHGIFIHPYTRKEKIVCQLQEKCTKTQNVVNVIGHSINKSMVFRIKYIQVQILALDRLYNLSESLHLYNGCTSISFTRMLSQLDSKQKVLN